MYNDHSSSTPTVVDCVFTGNYAPNGGGVFNASGSATFTDCAFTGNSAPNRGGGMLNDSSSPTITRCTFTGNSVWSLPYPGGAARGAGMYNKYSSPTVTNCTFSGNSSAFLGGAMYSEQSSPTVTSCTFSGNKANHGKALACDSDEHQFPSEVLIANCILLDGGDEVWSNDGSSITATHSDIQDDQPNDGVVYPGTGNIDTDPLMVDPGNWDDNGTPEDSSDDFWMDGDYRLQPGSPCINTGWNDAPDVLQTDLDGHARILCEVVDMGAYEFGIGDNDCDDDVDLGDFTAWEACMTGPDNGPYDPQCEPFDFEYDGDVDMADFAGMQAVFTGEP